eukprot:COSAG03_NODE_3353_length_2063_cov_2.040224_2_plen_187_part_00
MNKQQHHKSKKRRKGQAPTQPQPGRGGDGGVRITFLVNVWLGTGQLPEIEEFDAAAFRQELVAELDRPGATSGGQQREGREAVWEELRLLDDVSLELFTGGGGGGAAAAATGVSKKDAQPTQQLAQVSTGGGSNMPTVGLSFGTDKASFEIWIPCPTLRAGSSEVLYAGAHAEHMQGAECVVTRRA